MDKTSQPLKEPGAIVAMIVGAVHGGIYASMLAAGLMAGGAVGAYAISQEVHTEKPAYAKARDLFGFHNRRLDASSKNLAPESAKKAALSSQSK